MAPTAVGITGDDVVAPFDAGMVPVRRATASRAPTKVRGPVSTARGAILATPSSIEGRPITRTAAALEGAEPTVAKVASVIRNTALPVASLALVVTAANALVAEAAVGTAPV